MGDHGVGPLRDTFRRQSSILSLAALTKPSAGRRQQTASAFFSWLELELDDEDPSSPPRYVLTSFVTVLREFLPLLLPASSSALLSGLLPDTARERAEAHRQYWNSSPGMILSCPRGCVGRGGCDAVSWVGWLIETSTADLPKLSNVIASLGLAFFFAQILIFHKYHNFL